MRAKVIGQIPTKVFYNYADEMLKKLAKATIAYHTVIENAHALVKVNEGDSESANENRYPIDQQVFEAAHDQLMQAMDLRFYYYCYLLKINNFMPHLIHHFGDSYHYSESVDSGVPMPIEEWNGNVASYDFCKATMAQNFPHKLKTMKCSLDLINYSDPENIHHNLETITQQAFEVLHALRFKFTAETREKRQQNLNRDYFCSRFLENYEVEPNQIPSRMEYLFFIKSDIPLGIFEALPDVEKWLAVERSKPEYQKEIFNALKNERLSIIFPGIALRKTDGGNFTSDIGRELRRNMFGTIPDEGIYIGENSNLPKRNTSKPHLIR